MADDQLFDPPTLLRLRTLDREGRRRAMVYELANQLQLGLDPVDLEDVLGNMVLVAAARIYAAILAWCALPFDDRRLLPLQQVIDARTLVILNVLRHTHTGLVDFTDLRRLYSEGAETVMRAITIRALARGIADRSLSQRFTTLAWVLIGDEEGLKGASPDAVHAAIEAIVPETGEVLRQARNLLDEPTLQ